VCKPEWKGGCESPSKEDAMRRPRQSGDVAQVMNRISGPNNEDEKERLKSGAHDTRLTKRGNCGIIEEVEGCSKVGSQCSAMAIACRKKGAKGRGSAPGSQDA
jgi:hypothetical protein